MKSFSVYIYNKYTKVKNIYLHSYRFAPTVEPGTEYADLYK